jgi:nucleoid DNA-binding protein
MTQTELAGIVAAQAGLSWRRANRVLNIIFKEAIPEAIKQEGKVSIQGFGSFVVKKRSNKYNFQAKKVLPNEYLRMRFYPSVVMKRYLNGKRSTAISYKRISKRL